VPPQTERTGIGAAVLRLEDERFLTGRGRFVDDMELPNAAHAHVVRSPHAQARILAIDKSAALAAPGVLAVLTGEDVIREKIGGLPCEAFPALAEGSRCYRPLQPILATDKARIVHVHLSDAQERPPAEVLDNQRLMPGEGIVNLVGFLQALKKIGYQDGISPEPLGRISKEMTAEDAARLGLETTQAVMKKAGV